MTTSVLLTHGRYGLNDNDLQTLLDYAHDPKCPYEWRMAMEQLVEAYREYKDASAAEEERDDAEHALRDASKMLADTNQMFELLLPGEGTDGAKDWDEKLPKLRESLTQVLEKYTEVHTSLVGALTPPKPSGPLPPEAPAGDPGSRSPA